MKPLLLSLLLLTGYARVSSASLLIYVANGFSSSGTTLYQLDPSNGNVIGSQALSQQSLRGLTFGPDGTLYGTFYVTNVGNTRLGTINPATGGVTLAGGTAGGNALAFDGSSLYEDVSANITALDPVTGTAGSSFACNTFGQGLAFGGDGKAWRGDFNSVHEYALGGSCTGSGGGSPGSGAGPMYFSLAYENGLMYSIDTTNHQLVTFAGATFPSGGIPITTLIGSVSANINMLAVFDTGSAAPEPSSMALMGAGLICLAGFLRRRRSTR